MDGEAVKKRVLLAEEDGLQRQLIREYLETARRYEILEAQGIHHLLSICEGRLSGISLALLDMEWTQVDSVEVILEIRRRNPFLPILGMADLPNRFYNEPRLRSLTQVGFITKPFPPILLARCVSAILNARGAYRPSPRLKRGLTIQEGREDAYGQNPA